MDVYQPAMTPAARPRETCAFVECEVFIGNDKIGIDNKLVADAGAVGTRAVRAVKGEGAGAISPRDIPHWTQANCSLNSASSPLSASRV